MACIKRRVCDLQIGAETERLSHWEPTRMGTEIDEIASKPKVIKL